MWHWCGPNARVFCYACRTKLKVVLWPPEYDSQSQLSLSWDLVSHRMLLNFVFICLPQHQSNSFAVEHFLFFGSAIFNYHQRKKLCDFEITDEWKAYFTSEYRFIFNVIPYNVPTAIIVLVCVYRATQSDHLYLSNIFSVCELLPDSHLELYGCVHYHGEHWTVDAFQSNQSSIECFPRTGLSQVFVSISQRNRIPFFFHIQNISASIWDEIRGHYVVLCELVEYVDENLSTIILLSCANDLYFVCFQLLNIFKWVLSVIIWL